MAGRDLFKEIIEQTQVVKFPRHRLSTFGLSEIHYNLVSAVSQVPPRSHLRMGLVVAERPRILTPDALANQFEGFGEHSESFERWLKETFHEEFRGLEYRFRNQLSETAPHSMDARELVEKIQKDIEGRDTPQAALIFGPEKGWQFALMKFLLEETSQSFPMNARELEERGLFNPLEAAMNRRRYEIENLFLQARNNPARVGLLGQKLREYKLFSEYQDRFFSLVKGTH
ncbi:MAG TPA: hypothetical protein P5079_09620 [Elusimicrobiota bacterium]|nr:hypothetical protein [Elusimicrobiota bacterium]